MGDAGSLLLALVLIYLVECLVWLRPGALVFTSWLGSRFRLRFPGDLPGNTRGSLHLSSPLPPLGISLISQVTPVAISPQGLLGFAVSTLDPSGRPTQTRRYVAWDDVQSLELKGREIQVNGECLARGVTPVAARHLWHWLRQILKASPSDPGSEDAARAREKVISQGLQSGLEITKARARLDDFRQSTFGLRLWGNALFLYLFLVGPGLVTYYGMGQLGWWLIGGAVFQSVLLALWFGRVHKRFYREEDDERFKLFLTLLLAPPAAVRATDLLARCLLQHYHVLVAARLVLDRDAFVRLSRWLVADLVHPLPLGQFPDEEKAREVEAWFRRANLEVVWDFLKRSGLDPSTLEKAPAPSEEVHRGYCPRCHTQFVAPEGHCRECGNLPLRPLPDPKPGQG